MSNLQNIIAENERIWIFIAYESDEYGSVPIFSKLFNNHEKLKVFSAEHSKNNKDKVPGYHSDYLDLTDKSFIHSSQLRLIEGFREMVREKIEMIGEPQGFSDDCTWSKGKKEGFIDLLSELGSINEIK